MASDQQKRKRGNTDGAHMERGGVNHYASVISGMREGLLITVNNSNGANARSYPMLEVINQPVDGAVILETDTGEQYMMHQREDGDTVIEEYKNGSFQFGTFVETIEVAGHE